MISVDGIMFVLFFCLSMAMLVVYIVTLIQYGRDDELAEEALRALVVLPHFPYARQRQAAGASSPEPTTCAICMDELWQGQMCSEVPACRHIFHEGCIRAWAKKKNSCPLCRIRIVPGVDAYGMV